MEAERNRNLWTPPPVLRRLAWCILLGALAYEIVAGFRVALYTVHQYPAHTLIYIWQASPWLVVAPIAMVLCIPFLVLRGPRQKKKHVPDPALSIRPR
jgi:hypothetical protein